MINIQQAKKSNIAKNNKQVKKLIITGCLVAFVLIVLLLAFWIVPYTLHLLTVGFTLENILTDKLPSRYYSVGDGSVFNIVIFEIFLLKAVIICAIAYVFLLILAAKKHK